MYVEGSNLSLGESRVGMSHDKAALFSQYWSWRKPRIWA
jgi:hypothetical protein